MKPRSRSRSGRTEKKAEPSVKQAECGKVWVNPKSPLKLTCERAWSEAEVPSPKFIDMRQIDLRAKKPPELLKAKAAVAAAKSGALTKSPAA
ncbi:MAG: hypothetical protein ACXV8X_10040 [Candidatus Angelobacter sp.]